MSLDELNQLINQSAAMSLGDRQKSIRWLAHQNDLIVQDTFKMKKNHFHRLKSEGHITDNTLIEVLAFYLAIKEMIALSKITNRKNRSGNFGFLRKIGEIRAKQFRKPRSNLKREKLLNLQNVVLNLREVEGYSSRDVSAYLRKNHKFEISHTEILKFEKLMKKGQTHDDSNLQ